MMSEIQPKQDYCSCPPPTRTDAMDENHTPTAITCCGINTLKKTMNDISNKDMMKTLFDHKNELQQYQSNWSHCKEST